MSGDEPPLPVLPVLPDQSRRRRPGHPAGARIVRQLSGIDSWCAALTMRQDLPSGPGGYRDHRMDRARRQAFFRCVATVDVANSHPRFLGKFCAGLAASGCDSIGHTDDGADAIGAVVAEQPDLVIAGGRLEMTRGEDLLAETALFSPLSARLVRSDDDRDGALPDAVVPAAYVVERAACLPPAGAARHGARP